MSCSNKALKMHCGFKRRSDIRVERGGPRQDPYFKVVFEVSEG